MTSLAFFTTFFQHCEEEWPKCFCCFSVFRISDATIKAGVLNKLFSTEQFTELIRRKSPIFTGFYINSIDLWFLNPFFFSSKRVSLYKLYNNDSLRTSFSKTRSRVVSSILFLIPRNNKCKTIECVLLFALMLSLCHIILMSFVSTRP